MYENVVSDGAEILSVFSDMNGELWALAILCELLQEMCSAKNWQGAKVIKRKMYQVAEVKCKDEEMDDDALIQFAEIMVEGVEDALWQKENKPNT